jgi:hypothetical protein
MSHLLCVGSSRGAVAPVSWPLPAPPSRNSHQRSTHGHGLLDLPHHTHCMGPSAREKQQARRQALQELDEDARALGALSGHRSSGLVATSRWMMPIRDRWSRSTTNPAARSSGSGWRVWWSPAIGSNHRSTKRCTARTGL